MILKLKFFNFYSFYLLIICLLISSCTNSSSKQKDFLENILENQSRKESENIIVLTNNQTNKTNITTINRSISNESGNDLLNIFSLNESSPQAVVKEEVTGEAKVKNNQDKDDKRLTEAEVFIEEEDNHLIISDFTLSDIRDLYKKGHYKKITDLNFNKGDLKKRYYQALSYYCLTMATYNRRLKNSYIQKTKAILQKISDQTSNKELKAKSFLWYGIVLFRYSNKRDDFQKILKPFLHIRNHLKETRCYNDALFYSALLYQKHKKYPEALKFYRKLENTSRNNLIYDFKVKKMVSPQKACAYYMKKINFYYQPNTKINKKKETIVINQFKSKPTTFKKKTAELKKTIFPSKEKKEVNEASPLEESFNW